jgi:hypothetical protein
MMVKTLWLHIHLSTLLGREKSRARHWWLVPVILATQEAEIRRIAV